MTHKEYQRQYYLDHKEDLLKKHRITAKAFKERMKQKDPEGYKDYFRKYKREWDRKAALSPAFRLSGNLRSNMYHALKAKKGFRKWEDLVGYTLQDLINHLTPLLGENMSWNNYGEIWQVDHIVPKSWFKYEDTDDPKFKECWSLSNLQPKLKMDNIRKGNRYAG